MSVNTMAFEDAAAILNNIRKQVTGETAAAPINTSQFISVANTVLQAGYDPVMGAITQMVSRTIFSIRPYNRKFGGKFGIWKSGSKKKKSTFIFLRRRDTCSIESASQVRRTSLQNPDELYNRGHWDGIL